MICTLKNRDWPTEWPTSLIMARVRQNCKQFLAPSRAVATSFLPPSAAGRRGTSGDNSPDRDVPHPRKEAAAPLTPAWQTVFPTLQQPCQIGCPSCCCTAACGGGEREESGAQPPRPQSRGNAPCIPVVQTFDAHLPK